MEIARSKRSFLQWLYHRIERSRVQLVIRADYDLQRELDRLQRETGADSYAHVIECGLHALSHMVHERNRGAVPTFLQEDLALVPFKPDYLYGQVSDYAIPCGPNHTTPSS